MSLDASTVDADLEGIFDDFGDTLTVSATVYPGKYEESYIDAQYISGYAPIFSGKVSDLDGIGIDQAVTVTSDLYDLSESSFKVKEKILNGRLLQLVLSEA